MKRIGAVFVLLASFLGIFLFWTSALDQNGQQSLMTALYSLRSGMTALYEEENAAFDRCREAVNAAKPTDEVGSADTEELIARLQNQLRNASVPQEQKNVLQDTINQLRNSCQKDKQTNERLIYSYEQMEWEWARFLERFSQLSKRVEELPGRLGEALEIE